MLEEILKSINNYFPTGELLEGEFVISNGALELPLMSGQYYLLEGSVFNDGVHQYGIDFLEDETFKGSITPMAIPRVFLTLVEEIEQWNEKYQDQVASPFMSESFGGYSYTKSTVGSNSERVDWKSQFKNRLNKWRKV